MKVGLYWNNVVYATWDCCGGVRDGEGTDEQRRREREKVREIEKVTDRQRERE